MSMTLEDISDRIEINDLLVAYSHAVDFRDWDALDEVFTPDALIDYTAMGGPRGDLAATKAFLAETMPIFAGWQHMVATSKVTVRGDTAEARTICHNPMVLADGDSRTRTVYCGLWYRDTFVRTPDGWRISSRVEERCYLPPEFQPPA